MAQTLTRIIVHAVFSTKSREPVLDPRWRGELFRVLGGSMKRLGCRSLCLGGADEHVHLVFELGRDASLATTMCQLKSWSSAWINQNHPMRTVFRWQAGYAAFSIGWRQKPLIRKYVEGQARLHRHMSYQDELRRWLGHHGLVWDEQWIWE